MTSQEYKNNLTLLKKYSDAYYQGIPIATDEEYDKLYQDVVKYETDNNINNKTSITQQVGAKYKTNKIEHPTKMYSLNNVFDIEELEEWYNRVTNGDNMSLVVMPKYDGCSCNLIYQDGKLVEALTRGDGIRGESILHNVKYISNIPTSINISGRVELRGEIVIFKDTFETLNNSRIEEGLIPFSNPRNLASSSVRVKNIDISNRGLKFLLWGMITPSSLDYYTSQFDLVKDVMEIEDNIFKVNNIDTLIDKVKYLENIRNHRPYITDGLVIRINSLRLSEMMGYNNKYPKYAVAYKFPPIESITKLLDVNWQVGRTGNVTPVGILEPVTVGDVTVSNVTLHNISYIKNLDLKIGDSISIIRSGDVIPKISLVLIDRRKDVSDISIPRVCPDCKTKLINNGAYKVCTNRSCPSRVVASIVHFASKKAMNIDGLGDIVVQMLYDNDIVKSIEDLYKLSTESLENISYFGNIRMKKILEAIESTQGIELSRLIFGLGIDNIGEVASRKLATLGLDWYLQPLDVLSKVTGLNTTLVSTIHNYDKNTIKFLQDSIQPTIPVIEKNLNLTIVITGSLSLPRHELVNRLTKYNITVTSSVTKKIDYLVIGNNPTDHKVKKAKELNIKIINESDLLKLLSI